MFVTYPKKSSSECGSSQSAYIKVGMLLSFL